MPPGLLDNCILGWTEEVYDEGKLCRAVGAGG